eukprot:948769-Amphidinium_carterae.1
MDARLMTSQVRNLHGQGHSTCRKTPPDKRQNKAPSRTRNPDTKHKATHIIDDDFIDRDETCDISSYKQGLESMSIKSAEAQRNVLRVSRLMISEADLATAGS